MNIDFTFLIDDEPTDVDNYQVRLSSPDGTFGVRRLDNQDVVVADGSLMNRIAPGLYRYTFVEPEPNLGYEHYVEFEFDGAPLRFHRYNGNLVGAEDDYTPVSGRYTSSLRLYNKFGQENIYMWAQFSDGDTSADLIDRIQQAVTIAEDFIDDALRSTRYVIPFASPAPTTIRDIATIMAGVELYEARGIEDTEDGESSHRLSGLKRQASRSLDNIKRGALVLSASKKFNTMHPQIVADPPLSPTPTGNPGIYTDLEALPPYP